ncbi:MAG: hypothetical protein QXZ48_07925 [Zestosphaera sp.]|uniref:hypothetical protein n=1 Tax=Thermoprotei TaxID=183924 RepID=UPI00316125B3
MLVKALQIEFTSPYHVGWRRAESIIDGLTLHRALIALHNLVLRQSPIDPILNELRVSAVLPAVMKEGYYEPVLPLPPLPSRIRPKKAGFEWVTLSAAISLVEDLTKHRRLLITSVKDNKATIKLDSTTRELCIVGRILKLCEENIEVPQSGPIERFEAVLNRIDRLTNSADLFKISGYKARSSMIVMLQSNNDNVLRTAEELLKLSGDIGLGGLKSRGLGRFVIKGEAKINTKYFERKACAGYNLLLGSYVLEDPPVDLMNSFVNTRLLAGYSGPPQDLHILPYLSYAGAGSIIYVNKPPHPVIRPIKTSIIGSLLVFNPLIIGCCA